MSLMRVQTVRVKSQSEKNGAGGEGAAHPISGATSTGPLSIPWRRLKLGLSIGLACFGVGFLVFGCILPAFVENVISSGVKDLVRLDPNVMDADALADFQNRTGHQNFYLYNLTNLYQVLTQGAKPNFQEVGPIRTTKAPYRYNISWHTDQSYVEYDWLTTYTVHEDDQHYLSEKVIAPNPFTLGGAAQVLRLYNGGAAAMTDPTWKPNVRFTGNYLNEAIWTSGFFGQQVLPGVMDLFSNASSVFLTQVRGASMAYYTMFMPAYCGGQATCMNEAKGNWSTGDKTWEQSSPTAQALWTGFALPLPLMSSNPTAVANAVFDSNNVFGLANTAGLAEWAKLEALQKADPTSTATQTQAGKIMAGLGMDNPNDLGIIGAWLSTMTTTLPGDTAGIGAAYERSVCQMLTGVIQQSVTAGGGATVFSQLYANTADYVLTSWQDIGALQFGTGIVTASMLRGSAAFVDGAGASIAAAAAASSTDLAAMPFAFDSSRQEPVEFVQGILHYYNHNKHLTQADTASWWPGSSQAGLWQVNPSLLFMPDGVTPKQLTILQAKTLINLLENDPAAYGTLIQELLPIYAAYLGTFSTQFNSGDSTTWTSAINNATTAAQNAINVAKSTSGTYLGNSTKTGGLGLDTNNWYMYWTYFFNYVGTRLTGYLADLDPSSGVTPSNKGLFAIQTVEEMLFGYNVLGLAMPSIAGKRIDARPYQDLLNEDYLAHIGRHYRQDTGHKDIATVGQWIKYEGVSSYKTNCEYIDPGNDGYCNHLMDWTIWGEDSAVAGTQPITNSPPFHEDDPVTDIRLYVTQIGRAVPVKYTKDVEIKGIPLRRYQLNQAMIDADFVTPNPDKNEEQWYQSGVPDGLFSIQTLMGGVPAISSLPYFGLANSSVYSGKISCNGQECSDVYDISKHETFLDVHSLTGLTMNGYQRLQANFRVSAQEWFTGLPAGAPTQGSYPFYPDGFMGGAPPGGMNYHYNNLFACPDFKSEGRIDTCRETLYLPYYWSEIYDTISDDDAQKVRDSNSEVDSARKLASNFRIAGITVGVISMVAGGIGVGYMMLLSRRSSAYKK